jgi:hypothetical protein
MYLSVNGASLRVHQVCRHKDVTIASTKCRCVNFVRCCETAQSMSDTQSSIHFCTVAKPACCVAISSSPLCIRCRDMSALVSSALDTLRGYTGSTAWAPLVRISRAAVLSLFHRIEFGCLLLTDESGEQTRCGRDAGLGSHVCTTPPRTELKIKREAFWVRLALFADMVCQIGLKHRRLYG